VNCRGLNRLERDALASVRLPSRHPYMQGPQETEEQFFGDDAAVIVRDDGNHKTANRYYRRDRRGLSGAER